MAVSIVATRSGSANLSPAQLSQAREAFVERVNTAADRAMRRCEMGGMSAALVGAACFLADAGVIAPASMGETFFGWDVAKCRQYLDGLSPAARAEEIESGRKVLFDSRNAICPDIARARVEAAKVVGVLEARWAHNSAAYFARRARKVAGQESHLNAARG
jgi:hypothetical protein